jgi:hypothetical protein
MKIWFGAYFYKKNAEKSEMPAQRPKIILQFYKIQNIIPNFAASTVNFRTP